MTEIEQRLLRECSAGHDIKSSDRPADRARTRLKKLGYIVFNRETWQWDITENGRLALTSVEG